MKWNLFPRQPAPQTPEEMETAKRNTMRYSLQDAVYASFTGACGDGFSQLFLVFLNASKDAIAFFSTVPGVLGSLAQLAGASLCDRLGTRWKIIVPLAYVHALAYLVFFLLPAGLVWMGAGTQAVVWTAIAVWMAGVLVTSLTGPPWLSLLGDVVPGEIRGVYFARRNRIVMVAVLTISLLAGALMTWLQKMHVPALVWAGFGLLFSLAFLGRLASSAMLAKHYDPPYAPAREHMFSLWDFIKSVRRSNYTRYSFYNALMLGAVNISAPFFILYMKNDLHWNYFQIILNSGTVTIAQFFFIRWWGRLGDRYGNRAVIEVVSYLLPAVPVLWIFSTNFYWLLGVQAVAGAVWSGWAISTSNFTYDAVTSHKRARVASYQSILNSAFNMIGGMLIGAWLANHLPSSYQFGHNEFKFVSSLPGVFFASGVARLMVAAGMLRMFKEVRPVQRIHPVKLLLLVPGGGALAEFVQGALSSVRRNGGRNPDAD